jgi:ABC-type transporter Mla subunit MlaD
MSRVITMVLFALSCVGLLLFLWLSFGGTVPFNTQGYRVRISFPNASDLATQADVRIAGVNVGKVVEKTLDPQGNRTIATIQIDNKYAPIHEGAKAILREKTIINETYVDITPGPANAPPVPDGGLLPRGQVVHAVQLDEIFNAFDPTTRQAFQVWQQELAKAVGDCQKSPQTCNDQNLNDVFGNLPTFTADTTDIMRVLDIEHASVVKLIQNGGTVFGALSKNQAALRTLITTAETTFHTTAANNQALFETFQVFPTFLTQSQLTMARLQTFANDTDPLLKEFIQPGGVAQQLGPTFQALQQLSPDLRRLFVDLNPLIDAAKTGLPAYAHVLRGAKPLLNALGPFLEELNPIINWLGLHQQLISDFISNGAYGLAARTVSYSGGVGHYLRQFGPTGPETLSISPQRNPGNRGNTYPPPLWLGSIFPDAAGKPVHDWGLPSWDCNNTGGQHASNPLGPPPPTGSPTCWVQHPPGSHGQQIPRITKAHYSSH